MSQVLEALSKLDNIEEFSEVTGDFDILSVVSCSDMEEFRDVLKNRIQKIPGVKNTVSSIVLGTYKGSRIVYGSPPSTLVPRGAPTTLWNNQL
jgi:DNA-binding Lrp family transcriptional regulator